MPEANLEWEIDDDGDDCAQGLLEYIIDVDNELAVFHDGKCVAIRPCVDMDHAEAIAEAFEREAIRNAERGDNWRGKKGALI